MEGVLKRKWLEKMCGSVPAVLVLCIDWSEDLSQPQQDETNVRVFRNIFVCLFSLILTALMVDLLSAAYKNCLIFSLANLNSHPQKLGNMGKQFGHERS